MNSQTATLKDMRRLAAKNFAFMSLRFDRQRHGQYHVELFWVDRDNSQRRFVLWIPEEALPERDRQLHSFSMGAGQAQMLDRLITKLGPDWIGEKYTDCPNPPQARPKRTDQVAEATSKSDGELHGGDGASGETENPSPAPSPSDNDGPGETQNQELTPDSHGKSGETNGSFAPDGKGTTNEIENPSPATAPSGGAEQGTNSDERSATPTQRHAGKDTSGEPPGGACGTGQDRASPAGPDAIEAEVSRAQNDGARGELTAEGGTPLQPSETAVADTPQCDAADGAGAAESPAVEENEAPEKSGEGGPVTSPRPVFSPSKYSGGNFSDRDKAYFLSRYYTREAKSVARALRRLIRQLAQIGGQDETSRIDPRRLVRERVTCRWNFARIRRQEAEPGIFYLLADVSGSCSTCCTETLAACLAVAQEMGWQAQVLQHSNGHVVRPFDANEWPDENDDYITDWIHVTGKPVAGVVAFGDWDAGNQYRLLCESGTPFVWLDSYAAKHGVRPASRWLRAPAAGWKKLPLVWYQGVNSAKTAAIALRDAVRKIRRCYYG